MRAFTCLRLRSPSMGTGLAWLHDFGPWTEVLEWPDLLELLKQHHETCPVVWIETPEVTDKFLKELKKMRAQFPFVHVFLYAPTIGLAKYKQLTDSQLFWQIGTPATPVAVWRATFVQALEDFRLLQRQRHRIAASHNRNLRLIRMTQNLEQEVQKRTKKLFLSTQKLRKHETQLQQMRSLLMEINASDDIRGIYSVLSKELAHLMPFTELSIVLSDWASAGLLVIRGTKEADAEVVSLPTTDDDVLAGLFNGLEPVILERGPQLGKLLKTSCFALKNHASLFFVPLSVGKSKAAILIASHERHGFHTDHINTVRQLQPPLAVSLERVSTLGALKHLQQQWEATFHAIHHPLFILDEDLSLARTNAAADQLLHDLPDVDPLIRSFSTVGDVLKIRGREFQVLRTHFQHRNRQLILLQLREVTEEKDLHQRLLHSEKLATIGVLSEKVAHELNNPLAGIMALSQLLQPEFDEPIKGDLVEVERACRRCKHTIENLVQFSRASPGKSMESISLNSVIEETLMLARAGLKGIDIHLALDPHLPRVKGRFQELQQVIFNLIQNAAHAMQGQGNLFIETGIDPVTHRVHCKVRDTGDGIPAHIRPHIFQPFFTTKRVGVGTGLGLSICRKIMTEHGGDIKLLFSEEHQGTAFELMLRSEA